ncbi:MAG: hypothetical protein K5772_02230 [Clostridia bacterium]|nr:hypothetical protein [Bacillota bacterium]MBQ6294961.1 hypothetical protein [Bacillota bacterium]MBR0050835.1 hypothetical protein [Bacillota bacterium]MCR4724233.1 hypothetical protein [Clostridia bacterium]
MAGKKGQRTINIYAFFFSLVAFLFVMQLGTGIAGALMGFRYPDGLLGMTGVINTISLIIVLTAIFLAASSAGFIVIRKAEADKKNFIIYHSIVIAVMALSAIYIVGAYKNVWFILPNLFTIAATAYSLKNVNKSKYEVVKGTRAWRNEQARKERAEMKAKMKQSTKK